ncbi:MAG: hypothetical protein OEY01_03635 [Desulfobulbaceae bacterium]|nr:hypothetical protein [Desulfobulbaceae bacterium]
MGYVQLEIQKEDYLRVKDKLNGLRQKEAYHTAERGEILFFQFGSTPVDFDSDIRVLEKEKANFRLVYSISEDFDEEVLWLGGQEFLQNITTGDGVGWTTQPIRLDALVTEYNYSLVRPAFYDGKKECPILLRDTDTPYPKNPGSIKEKIWAWGSLSRDEKTATVTGFMELKPSNEKQAVFIELKAVLVQNKEKDLLKILYFQQVNEIG